MYPLTLNSNGLIRKKIIILIFSVVILAIPSSAFALKCPAEFYCGGFYQNPKVSTCETENPAVGTIFCYNSLAFNFQTAAQFTIWSDAINKALQFYKQNYATPLPVAGTKGYNYETNCPTITFTYGPCGNGGNCGACFSSTPDVPDVIGDQTIMDTQTILHEVFHNMPYGAEGTNIPDDSTTELTTYFEQNAYAYNIFTGQYGGDSWSRMEGLPQFHYNNLFGGYNTTWYNNQFFFNYLFQEHTATNPPNPFYWPSIYETTCGITRDTYKIEWTTNHKNNMGVMVPGRRYRFIPQPGWLAMRGFFHEYKNVDMGGGRIGCAQTTSWDGQDNGLPSCIAKSLINVVGQPTYSNLGANWNWNAYFNGTDWKAQFALAWMDYAEFNWWGINSSDHYQTRHEIDVQPYKEKIVIKYPPSS